MGAMRLRPNGVPLAVQFQLCKSYLKIVCGPLSSTDSGLRFYTSEAPELPMSGCGDRIIDRVNDSILLSIRITGSCRGDTEQGLCCALAQLAASGLSA